MEGWPTSRRRQPRRFYWDLAAAGVVVSWLMSLPAPITCHAPILVAKRTPTTKPLDLTPCISRLAPSLFLLLKRYR